jgi:hypothetical protein
MKAVLLLGGLTPSGDLLWRRAQPEWQQGCQASSLPLPPPPFRRTVAICQSRAALWGRVLPTRRSLAARTIGSGRPGRWRCATRERPRA